MLKSKKKDFSINVFGLNKGELLSLPYGMQSLAGLIIQ